ncbi:OsmC family peroxiredoxin [Flavobacterium cupreum]|uniref:OsmC family peroxiredoxin n=1 Tax=Flavobacterium cupreum TaxID=2133766 RepID=A0A434ADU2_9FLAO|nr:OsmC family peroxiredoxin [Flavobacterium cupreum]RUT72549.1 OsmC family peroxiredoxin [Flavobacterium cupreum]
MKRTAKAQWTGSVKEGKGELTTQSGILNKTNYSFKTRFTGEEKGTNPEELLAAAHAGCFTMAVSFALTEQGMPPTALTTEAVLSMEGFDISGIHLSITGIVPGISAETFNALVKVAEKDCLISKALRIAITSEAHLAFIEN